tara:strand:- start:13388 stop:13627 length:240 start_codon:yes stop_codon:yes gene_type:complete
MKITNSEYTLIIDSLENEKHESNFASKQIDNLLSRLRKEYNEIAERNLAEGMSPEEEEVYPSRLYSEYGGKPIGDREVE